VQIDYMPMKSIRKYDTLTPYNCVYNVSPFFLIFTKLIIFFHLGNEAPVLFY
jgi:hypothetical protein